MKDTNQTWIKIPRDKHGFIQGFTLYEELPIIVADTSYDVPSVYYIDNETWADWCSDLDKARYTYYIKVPEFIKSLDL